MLEMFTRSHVGHSQNFHQPGSSPGSSAWVVVEVDALLESDSIISTFWTDTSMHLHFEVTNLWLTDNYCIYGPYCLNAVGFYGFYKRFGGFIHAKFHDWYHQWTCSYWPQPRRWDHQTESKSSCKQRTVHDEHYVVWLHFTAASNSGQVHWASISP